MLHIDHEHGKMVTVRGGHAVCPRCHSRMSPKILPTTVGKDIVLYCRFCKNEIITDIERGQRLKGRGQ